jgi:hypothetical protein
MDINIWLEYSASIDTIFRGQPKMESIFLNVVTQQQSMYEACSVSNVPMVKIFFEQTSYFVVADT